MVYTAGMYVATKKYIWVAQFTYISTYITNNCYIHKLFPWMISGNLKYSLTTVDQNLFRNYMHTFEIFNRILKSFMKMIIKLQIKGNFFFKKQESFARKGGGDVLCRLKDFVKIIFLFIIWSWYFKKFQQISNCGRLLIFLVLQTKNLKIYNDTSQQKEVNSYAYIIWWYDRWMSTCICLLPFFIYYKQYQKVPHYHTQPLSVWTSALGVSLSACFICCIPDTLHTWDVFH